MIDWERLAEPMTGEGCRAELFNEGNRQALKSACAEDGEIWQIYANNFGPGGFDASGAFVPGSILDGAGFNPDNAGGTSWISLLGSLRYSGDRAVPDAAVVTVLDDSGTRASSEPPLQEASTGAISRAATSKGRAGCRT